MKCPPQAGVAVGIVKSIDDNGCVQLEYPWLEGSPRSPPAPIAAPLAGKGRGAFFMPEVDDEVVVGFQLGDFDHPVVIGFLWNGVDTAPETDPANRIILTPGGHTLRFEDGDGKKKIVIKSAGEHHLTIDDDPAKTSITITTKGSRSLELSDAGSGKIVLSGGGRTVTMENGQVKIT
jgi:uncharacterized protein involved in type VI secretion and phage assembly